MPSLRPMFESLPPACQQGDQALLFGGLSAAVDDVLVGLDSWWTDYYRNLVDPYTVEPNLIDFVARLPSSPWLSVGWDPDWELAAKRSLLARSTTIFANRYTPKALEILFSCFNLAAIVDYQSGWIIGPGGVGTPLGTTCIIGAGLTAYRIKAPAFYRAGTRERGIVDWCLKNFGLPVAIDVILT